MNDELGELTYSIISTIIIRSPPHYVVYIINAKAQATNFINIINPLHHASGFRAPNENRQRRDVVNWNGWINKSWKPVAKSVEDIACL